MEISSWDAEYLQLQMLGSFVNGNASECWHRFPEEQRSLLLKMAHKYRLKPFYYRMLFQELPGEIAANFKKDHQACAIMQMQMNFRIQKLYQLLESEQIRFVPLKGIDLAFRCYPAPEIRPFGDWDIWIHPADCDRALTVLQNDGWQAPFLERKQLPGKHHYTPHRKEGIMLEPHWTLPHFESVAPEELWAYARPASPGSYRHVLSPELNLLLLTRHTATGDYRHSPLHKLLLDTVFLIRKEKVDWQLLKKMSENWQIPYPGDILYPWPEIFTETERQEMLHDAQIAGKYRHIFELLLDNKKITNHEWIMNQQDFGSLDWIRLRLRRLSFRQIRIRYHLPEKGASCRVLYFWCVDFCRKTGLFFYYLFRRNTAVNKQQDLIRNVEDRKQNKQ